MAKKTEQKILGMADLHCGHLTGLTPPEHMSDDTRATQEPLWKWYVDTLAKIGPVDALVVNGDMVDGEGKKETLGHLTTDTMKQAGMAAECIGKVKAERVFLTYGTPFHTVGSFSYEEAVAEKLNQTVEDSVMVDMQGVKFNFRHACGRSDIPYGQGTQTFKEAILDVLRADAGEYESADVTVRAHVHYYCRMEVGKRSALTLPCLQIPESVYGRKCRHAYYDIGMVLFRVVDGCVNYEPYIMPLKMVQKREYVCL